LKIRLLQDRSERFRDPINSLVISSRAPVSAVQAVYLYILQAPSAVLPGASSESFAARLFGDESPLGTVVVPQSAEYLAGDHLAHVEPDQPDDEHAVATQVVLRELAERSRLPRRRVHDADRRVHDADLLPDVLDVSGPVQA